MACSTNPFYLRAGENSKKEEHQGLSKAYGSSGAQIVPFFSCDKRLAGTEVKPTVGDFLGTGIWRGLTKTHHQGQLVAAVVELRVRGMGDKVQG
jgi:hypothetical protein